MQMQNSIDALREYLDLAVAVVRDFASWRNPATGSFNDNANAVRPLVPWSGKRSTINLSPQPVAHAPGSKMEET